MRKSLVALTTLLILGTVAPLWGGTIYVPYAVNKSVRGHLFTTEIRVHNDDNQSHKLTYLFIPVGQDGMELDRETEPIEVTIPGHVTTTLDGVIPEGERGMLEIDAEPEIAVTARLIGSRDGGETTTFGVEMPVTTSANAIAAGNTAIVQGLKRVDGRVLSDFYITNLSIERTQCAVEVRKRGGGEVVEEVLSVPPLSLNPFYDVLGLLGIDNASDVSFAVTCDHLARSFAVTQDLETAETLFIPPSGTGSSSLDPFPANDCAENALFRLDGVFHVPQSRNESAIYFVPTTPGETYDRLILTMEFTHGGWSPRSSDNHSVFWINRTSQWTGNVFGYLNLFGPNKNYAKNITNVDEPRQVINSVQQGAKFEPGTTYTVSYVYDTRAAYVEIVIGVKGGGEVVRMTDRPSVNRIVTDDNLMLVFGHKPHGNAPEVATYNWRYANVCLRLE